ncbi:polar amino acid transport system permease protein [Clostridium grantii DSM 8605]|uniref:Polar amino acid transport system permease protein n=1 Tax=Clostridium grantii DSM 8605 TaxID=1121316 RepID=A0A1M5XEX0_9CLOT|nr:polar amino acid transport system permease protein [Clostridium grantii DSM 8605]
MSTSSINQNKKNIKIVNKKDTGINGELIQKILAYVIVIIAFGIILFTATDNLRYDLILKEMNLLVNALYTTLWVSVLTLIISMVSGFMFYVFMNSENAFLRTITNLMKEIVMGTPLLVMIFLVVYVLGVRLGINEKLALGILALTCYMTPYIANAYETASAVVDEDQYTVMNLYHFNGWQKYRYIIIPQMIKPLIPSMINNLSSIIKGSALLKIVSVSEISYIITVISNKSYAAIEGYLVMWVMYLIITIPLSLLARYVGRRFSV